MSKVFVCPRCKREYEERIAKSNKWVCINCLAKLKEKKVEKKKEYEIVFDNFTISFTLPVKLGRSHQKEFESNLYISRNHCEIVEENGIIFVVDTSINGTFINGNKITTKTSINPNDKIKLANLEGVFKEKG